MDKTAEENALSNIGFTADANEEETSSSGGGVGVAEEEAEHADETTETEESAEEESREDEEESSEEGEAESEEETAAAADETPQGYDLLLPNKQQKVYPDELYQLAAKKFGVEPSLVQNKSIRSLLKGKIDSDIDNRNLRDRLDTGAEDDTIVDEEAETEEAPARRTAGAEIEATPAKQMEATYSFLRGGLDGRSPIITKDGAKLYSDASLSAYSDLQAAIDSGDPKKLEAAQIKYTESQAAFATVMFANVFPALLPYLLQAVPSQTWDGIVGGKLEEREEMKEVHQSARAELMKDPRYSDFKELVESKAIYNFARENPEILDKTFVDANGRPIKDPVKLNMARYRYIVHQIRGQNYRPPVDLVRRATESGRRQANAIAERKAAGRLSTGRGRGNQGTSGDRYETKNWAERMKNASKMSDPLGSFLEANK